eukprot:CAMPEP_0184679942 /NCGR_PEP_ID=MMETSP0312-20130426/2814_1 /TAXON_ID=31354 /ORGANISM="Compsopogon coeruleus, Strain SAG 36.94" /LENGTH=210 /DNA_ID=CAMNT_0027129731 /DNA_START=348 /DNA_END=981 /DNA_ORIENTATION=+
MSPFHSETSVEITSMGRTGIWLTLLASLLGSNANGLVIKASKTSAAGLQYAEERGIPRSVLRPKDFSHVEEFSAAISEEMDRHAIDLVVLAGWMHFYQIPSRYEGRVLNIHPSLIPAFCGQGYYGTKVHQAVLDFGAKITGCTVHFADNQFDHGPVILQRSVPVLDDDTVESLAARVFEEEKLALPEAIQMIADDRIEVRGRRVRVRGGA